MGPWSPASPARDTRDGDASVSIRASPATSNPSNSQRTHPRSSPAKSLRGGMCRMSPADSSAEESLQPVLFVGLGSLGRA